MNSAQLKLQLLALLATTLLGFTLQAADYPVSLQDFSDIKLDDAIAGDGTGGWTDEGPENSLHSFPTGRQIFEGIAFDIPAETPAVLALRGKAWPKAPSEITIPVAGPGGSTFYVLSTHAWKDGPIELARFIVRFENGREESYPLINFTHTGRWWNPVSTPSGPVVWRGLNRHGIPVGVYMAGFDLGISTVPIKSITIKGNQIGGQLLILGITLSDKPTSKIPRRPQWVTCEDKGAGWFSLGKSKTKAVEPVWSTIPSSVQAIDGRMLLMELTPSMSAPASETAVSMVQLLRSLGYTGVRTSPLDPLLAPGQIGSRGAGLAALLTLLQKNGLTSSVTLAGGRIYMEKDGVAAFRDLDPRFPELFFVDPAATQLMQRDVQEFWKKPPVATLAPSALMFDGGLFSYHLDDLSRPHRRMLLSRWSAWLRERYNSQKALEAAWQVPGQTSPLLPDDNYLRSKVELLSLSHILAVSPRFRRRIADQITFLDSIQREWFHAQKDFAHKNLPAANWSTTTWISPVWLRDIQTGLAASLDVVEDRADPVMADVAPEDGKICYLGTSPLSHQGVEEFLTPYYRVAGKPFIVWDSTGTWPGEHEFVRILRNMAMAAIQGWDGILHRSLDSISTPEYLAIGNSPPCPAFQNPSTVAILHLGRNLFIRGDLSPAKVVLRRPLLLPGEIPTKLPEVPSRINPLGDNFPAWLPYVGRVEAGIGLEFWRDDAAISKCKSGNTITSVTGEIKLKTLEDLLEINTLRSVALIGSLDGKAIDTPTAIFRTKGGYGAVYATSVDGAPLSESLAILVGLVGRCKNTGQVAERSTEPRGDYESVLRLSNPGKPPIVMETISAEFRFPTAKPGKWTITPLDAFGHPVGPVHSPKVQPSSGLSFSLDNSSSRAPLFLLRHE